jgi:hypothetical protein
MNAAFMSFQPHESGIHAVRSGAGEASVTKVRFRCAPHPRYKTLAEGCAIRRRRLHGGIALAEYCVHNRLCHEGTPPGRAEGFL